MSHDHHAVIGNIVGWALACVAYLFWGTMEHLPQLAALASLVLSVVLLYKELRNPD